MAGSFAARIVGWQGTHGRSELPWLGSRDPYRVWLSEVMLQQTQVSTVLGYFQRFLDRFPNVAALAEASEDEVFGLWSGLGYYSRARNMHRCAQEVVVRFNGAFPSTAAELKTLPGIGQSTAAAISAFCHGERVAILDGNVKRVLTRVLAFAGDLSSAAQERALWAAATELLPSEEGPDRAVAAYTQGVMDLGATVCTPRKPACLMCPVADLCAARAEGAPESYPVKSRKIRRSSVAVWALVARDSQRRVWLEKRAAKGIWAGLHCLPLYESRDALLEGLAPKDRLAVRDGKSFLHVLTHKDLHMHPMSVDCTTPGPVATPGRWFDEREWLALGLPAPIRKLLLESA
ncbi:MAG: A/G-specific adenine glycosylase [Gammaproteobacteria bacterium]|nr:A/G-specific adenine glycosylase [Gammaproteobacteria bacterium]MBU1441018.1 A/G-specific adenine glycosylase [Gammaproteobacteria bacterium]MBU2287725.1 A/G-specific adenine glycosylase [Gammaproteobacteria bacterium]MBU2409563.1 A/G-specific adenine glycosylase [Gammaproteobacteria bacterium]